jgi:nucleotide-binding universal stress UspA family protein
MAFRRIDVESTGFLADQRIQVGTRQDTTAFKEDARFEFIAGSFSATGGSSARYYYIGKYEVTQLQYAAIHGDCLSPSTRLRLPATDISWFDAIDISRLYSEWLLQNGSSNLPHEEGIPAFVRLPTETEWEFAARGGLMVDAADFSGVTFPTPDGALAEYVWYQGSESAAGSLRPVGLLQPNPLGIHDILGNASEFTLDLFHLNRRGRPHGQAGGYVTRGGDITTPRSQMRTSLRNENQFFDLRTGRARIVPNTGLRLVLTIPVIVSQERLSDIQQEWQALPAPDLGAARADQQRDALAQLASISQHSDDVDLTRRLDSAVRELEQARTDQNDVRNRAIRALIQSGGIIGNKVKTDSVLLVRMEAVFDDMVQGRDQLAALVAMAETSNDPGSVARARRLLVARDVEVQNLSPRLEQIREDSLTTVASYSDLVFNVASDYSMALIGPQLEALVADYQAQGFNYLIPFAQTFVSHIETYRQSGHIARDEWAADLIALGGTHDQ